MVAPAAAAAEAVAAGLVQVQSASGSPGNQALQREDLAGDLVGLVAEQGSGLDVEEGPRDRCSGVGLVAEAELAAAA